MAEAAISLSEIQAIEMIPVLGRDKKCQNIVYTVAENMILRKIHSKRLGRKEEVG